MMLVKFTLSCGCSPKKAGHFSYLCVAKENSGESKHFELVCNKHNRVVTAAERHAIYHEVLINRKFDCIRLINIRPTAAVKEDNQVLTGTKDYLKEEGLKVLKEVIEDNLLFTTMNFCKCRGLSCRQLLLEQRRFRDHTSGVI